MSLNVTVTLLAALEPSCCKISTSLELELGPKSLIQDSERALTQTEATTGSLTRATCNIFFKSLSVRVCARLCLCARVCVCVRPGLLCCYTSRQRLSFAVAPPCLHHVSCLGISFGRRRDN